MAKKSTPLLGGVSETLLIALYARALESQRPDAILHDERAVEIVKRLGDLSQYRMHGHDQIALAVRVQQFDAQIQDFLKRNPDGIVVHIGCGLDTRFERVDNGRVEWFDLDLPDVIDLRRKLIGGEGPRYHLLSCSILEEDWLAALSPFPGRALLFVAEGVFVYFSEAQVRAVLLTIRSCFAGAELICDAHTPFIIWADNLHMAFYGLGARMHWGLKNPRDVEGWAPGMRLLDEFYYFASTETRMRAYNWMGRIPFLSRSAGIFHYRLGSAP